MVRGECIFVVGTGKPVVERKDFILQSFNNSYKMIQVNQLKVRIHDNIPKG